MTFEKRYDTKIKTISKKQQILILMKKYNLLDEYNALLNSLK